MAPRARGRGRPRSKEKLVKVIAYVKPSVYRAVKRAAKATSTSAWVAGILEREAGLGREARLPDEVYLPGPADPRGLTRRALRADRDARP